MSAVREVSASKIRFPTGAESLTRPRDKARRILIRAIELAVDNGEFGCFWPSEKEWNNGRGYESYMDEAGAEELRGLLPYNDFYKAPK